MAKHILLIDDDSEVLLSYCRILKAKGLEARIDVATSSDKALELARLHQPEVAVLDLSLDDAVGVESGFSTLSDLLATVPFIRVIILTGSGSDTLGVRALRQGAASFLHKPANPDHLLALIEDGISQARLLRGQINRSTDENQALLEAQLVGTSDAIKNLRAEIAFAAKTNQSVMLSGESGVGKSFCSKLIHQLSDRKAKPFVRFQPSFCNNDLIASELFGHKKGTFTGAINDRIGLVEEANEGTLFLDEIDMLPIPTQVSMLGVLQDKHFSRVGESKQRASQFRIVVATNAPIDQALSQGTLRRDFYYRCASFTINIPPLRERREDIPELTRVILENLRWQEKLNVFGITDPALSSWKSHNWPGNIRELEAAVQSAAIKAQIAGRTRIELEDVQSPFTPSAPTTIGTLHEECRRFRIELVNRTLAMTDQNQTKAAQMLGVDRATLRRVLGGA
jgi:DNA-binding NtrC family response regulator